MVEAWAFGPWATARKPFRLIRSVAFLAFFDHPEVHAAAAVPGLVPLGGRKSSVLP